jgi:hypothetical protein
MKVAAMPKAAPLNFANTSESTRGKSQSAPRAKAKTDSQVIAKADRPDREGKKLVATHLPRAAYTALRILAAKLGTTQAALIEEALTDLMHKYQDQF